MAKKTKAAAKNQGNPEVTRLAEDAARYLKEYRTEKSAEGPNNEEEIKNQDGGIETTPHCTEAPNSDLSVLHKPEEKRRWWDRLFRRHVA
ncbi:MAG TPA: hypothetical protein VGJ20_30985 [Xanthobacteraceae bacterium]